MRVTWSSALGSHWRREVLRTNLWVVPSLEVLGAAALFGCTLVLDRAAYRGSFAVPSWVISGSADAARQILTAIAAAVITVVGVVFSIILVTLTLASTQFGPRMLRNFIRDRGTQLTLGTFVATFVYAVLVLVSIGPGPHGEFVPHIGVTTTLGLMVADLAILIYFIHHTAVSIQLPLVIAGIARDLAGAIEAQGGGHHPCGGGEQHDEAAMAQEHRDHITAEVSIQPQVRQNVGRPLRLTVRWQVQQVTGCAVHAVRGDQVGGGDVLQAPVGMPQQRRDPGPARLRLPARLSRDERGQLSPVFGRHLLAGKLLPQHARHLSLTGQQHVPAMIGVRGEPCRAEQPAFPVDGGVRDPADGRKRFRAEAALLEEFGRQ